MRVIKEFDYEFKDPENFILDTKMDYLFKMNENWNLKGDETEKRGTYIVAIHTKSPAIVSIYKEYEGEEGIFMENGIPIYKRKHVRQEAEDREQDTIDKNSLIIGPNSLMLGFSLKRHSSKYYDYIKGAFKEGSSILGILDKTFKDMGLDGEWGYKYVSNLTYLTIDDQVVGYMVISSNDNLVELVVLSLSVPPEILEMSSYESDLSKWLPEEREKEFLNKVVNNTVKNIARYRRALRRVKDKESGIDFDGTFKMKSRHVKKETEE